MDAPTSQRIKPTIAGQLRKLDEDRTVLINTNPETPKHDKQFHLRSFPIKIRQGAHSSNEAATVRRFRHRMDLPKT